MNMIVTKAEIFIFPPSVINFNTIPTALGTLTTSERWCGTINLVRNVAIPTPYALDIEP
jgi:hypothetical protein